MLLFSAGHNRFDNFWDCSLQSFLAIVVSKILVLKGLDPVLKLPDKSFVGDRSSSTLAQNTVDGMMLATLSQLKV
ncbi:MAG: hypothetical protein ACFB4I_02310 [Cyanophyceae cyanobacterium]